MRMLPILAVCLSLSMPQAMAGEFSQYLVIDEFPVTFTLVTAGGDEIVAERRITRDPQADGVVKEPDPAATYATSHLCVIAEDCPG